MASNFIVIYEENNKIEIGGAYLKHKDAVECRDELKELGHIVKILDITPFK